MKRLFKRNRTTPKNIRPINAEVVPWLIAALMLVTVPHLPRLPFWTTFFVLAIVVYKLLTLKYPKLRPGRMVVIILTAIGIAAVMLQYTKLFGRDSGVNLLVLMLFLKLLETRSYRDGMVLIALTYFLVITNFLYSQSIPVAFFMLFVVGFITFCLISLNQGKAGISLAEKIRLTAPLLILALPVMALLFLLFPRIPGPLWGLPDDVYGAKTGLSEEMTPGQISQLAFSDDVAFRVKFNGTPPSPAQLYWRAIVFWDYDGRTWRPGNDARRSQPVVSTSGTPVEYTVTLEPHQRRWLFALDLPVLDSRAKPPSPGHYVLTPNMQLLSSKPIISLSQYRIRSYFNYRLGEKLTKRERTRALQLPPYRNPKAIELANEWRQTIRNPADIIDTALRLFNRDFTYTLRPPVLGADAVDEFIFNTRRGFCEHFAGSFVFLMRAAGIPARIVTGYQGGEVNPLGDYMLIRQADAHAWAEVWLDGRGWVRVDPTTAVSPARIQLGLDAAIPARENPRFLLRRDNTFFNHLDLLLDSINNRWNEWVLGYGPEMQNLFLSRFGVQNPRAYDLVLWLTVSLGVTLGLIALISLKRIPNKNRDKVQRYYLKLCKRLAHAGYERRPHEGPQAYLKRIKGTDPELGSRLDTVIELYAELRYGPERLPANVVRLKQLSDQVKLSVNPDQRKPRKAAM